MLYLEMQQYAGWENCLHLTNGLIDLIITTDVGPRIIHLGFKNQPNLFYRNSEASGKKGGNEWVNYGGHRLWHAPEYPPRTYLPDNAPVQYEEHDGYVRMIQALEVPTGIQKEMDIAMHETKAQVKVTHRLRNYNAWDVELAPWALSVMAHGGTAILPLPKRGLHAENLTPLNNLALWAYTDMSDPRWKWGREFIFLKQDSAQSAPQKLGIHSMDGWVAYWNHGSLFVKTIFYDAAAVYTDLGCNIEVFTNSEMLELETLGPLVHVKPQQAVEHIETWYLAEDIALPDSEQELHNIIKTILF